VPYKQSGRIATLTSPMGENALVLRRMVASEALSEPFAITVDGISDNGPIDLGQQLGQPFHVKVSGGPGAERLFHGRLWEFSELERDAEGDHYRLVLRPFLAFMGLNRSSRIYQAMTVKDVVSDVFSRRGVSAWVDMGGVRSTYDTYEYCVQYQESDLDFVSRLMEHEGLYYWFEHSDSGHLMKIVDDARAHAPVAGLEEAEYIPRSQTPEGRYLWSAAFRHAVAPLKAMGRDYDFTVPSNALETTVDGTDASPADKDELYLHPVGYNVSGQRAQYVKRRIEAARAPRARLFAHGDVFAAATGHTLTLAQHPNPARNIAYLVASATHRVTAQSYRSGTGGGEDELDVDLELMPKTDQFRPPLRTLKPRIPGPQTAMVVGTAGEEIETDKYGRVKVQFPWDREGVKNEKSSCWMRVAQSVAGAGWGAFTLPRIGQEVVVEFLEGDPDRPIVTGGVYNAQTTVPYALPDNKTRQTFKTNSTKGGGGFNELRFEDKKGSEEVFFHVQKDLNSVVDKGDETRKLIEGSRTTTIQKGDETLLIEVGKRTATIKGDDSLTLKQGNHSQKIEMGNQTIKLDLGAVQTEAMQSITLKVGQSSIVIDQMGVTIKGMMISIKGEVQTELQGLLVTQNADAMMQVKGGIVMIN
jgi:type VI secretion system secreted protein VgrG